MIRLPWVRSAGRAVVEAPRLLPAPETRVIDLKRDGLTIVTPSFEKHVVQFGQMIDSLVAHCRDLPAVRMIVVVEAANRTMFADLLRRYPTLNARIVVTEDILTGFGIRERPADFLRRMGKFTFQTLKKFGALRQAETDWSLVLDSECLFHADFSAAELLDDYRSQKYVFYTYTAPRGSLWQASTGYQVTRNAAAALGTTAGDRWYMEYFHWFYETAKLRDLVDNRLGRSFFERLADPATPQTDYFENILYYLYLQQHHAAEYDFIDFKAALDTYLPPHLAARFRLDELPFALFGNEYLLNILSPDDVADLAPLFARYRLPFVRLEPPVFSTRYFPALRALPSFVATISSHHAIWLRKKIAVLVSGEFRHVVHRTPEHHVRHLLGFLSGVDCDVYLHGWSNPSEALIVDELKPRAYAFEERPSFADLARRVAVTEPRIKPGRDEGSMAMFHGMREAWRLMEPNIAEYDYVLRIRPDLYSEVSLKEMLVKISDEGDFIDNAIYVPRSFHSKGINDQIALGPVDQMRVYCDTLGYIERDVARLFFNPETVLLRHLLEHGAALAMVDMPYALMREVPIRIGTIHERFQQQFHVWWSRTEDLPLYQDLSAYFADKLAAMDAMMRETVPPLIYVRGPDAEGGSAVVRAKRFDADPSRPASGLFRKRGYWRINGFLLDAGGIRCVDRPPGRHLFLFPQGDDLVMSEWRMQDGRLVNHRLVAKAGDASPVARALGIRIGISLFLDHRRRKRAERAHRRGFAWWRGLRRRLAAGG